MPSLSQLRRSLHQCIDCGHAVPCPARCTPCATAHFARLTRPGPNLLGCCGQWHAVAGLPYTTSCCGRTYDVVEETPACT
jgi:hypothetical protein